MLPVFEEDSIISNIIFKDNHYHTNYHKKHKYIKTTSYYVGLKILK